VRAGWKPRGDAGQRRKRPDHEFLDLPRHWGCPGPPERKPVNIAPDSIGAGDQGQAADRVHSCIMLAPTRPIRSLTSVTSGPAAQRGCRRRNALRSQYRGRKSAMAVSAIRVGASELLASPVVTERDDKHSREQGRASLKRAATVTYYVW
jgi:hypothetical protein